MLFNLLLLGGASGQILPEPDCSLVDCADVQCQKGEFPFLPPGECCEICLPELDCSAFQCLAVTCDNPITPPGQCCPICESIPVEPYPCDGMECPSGTECEVHWPPCAPPADGSLPVNCDPVAECVTRLGCVDDTGNQWEHGASWGNVCSPFTCLNGEIAQAAVDCMYFSETDCPGTWTAPSADECCGVCDIPDPCEGFQCDQPACPADMQSVLHDGDCCEVCEPVTGCALMFCGPGQMCQETEVECIQAPCPLLAECVDIGPPIGCKTWFDGCNSCEVDWSLATSPLERPTMACTEKACLVNKEPKCLKWDVPDCSLVLCAEPMCIDGTEPTTEPGQCCPVCKPPTIDCSMVRCAQPICPAGEVISFQFNECCGTCVPDLDCSAVSCIAVACDKGFEPVTFPGTCCPTCVPEVPNCAAVSCPMAECDGALVVQEGECCPTCVRDLCADKECAAGTECELIFPPCLPPVDSAIDSSTGDSNAMAPRNCEPIPECVSRSGCVDENGEQHEHGDSWGPVCSPFGCNDGEINQIAIDCFPEELCHGTFTPPAEGQCCGYCDDEAGFCNFDCPPSAGVPICAEIDGTFQTFPSICEMARDLCKQYTGFFDSDSFILEDETNGVFTDFDILGELFDLASGHSEIDTAWNYVGRIECDDMPADNVDPNEPVILPQPEIEFDEFNTPQEIDAIVDKIAEAAGVSPDRINVDAREADDGSVVLVVTIEPPTQDAPADVKTTTEIYSVLFTQEDPALTQAGLVVPPSVSGKPDPSDEGPDGSGAGALSTTVAFAVVAVAAL